MKESLGKRMEQVLLVSRCWKEPDAGKNQMPGFAFSESLEMCVVCDIEDWGRCIMDFCAGSWNVECRLGFVFVDVG